ncbi:RNA polymerase sigma factor [Pedobacter psychroterrae]|uniref:RNA polymerase sigma-70 factor n=1 Tax=Pedobacter psychroterrae TaxID=2530453 RepID=A0A4R0NWH0_9SPHI|nr:RNA polymerase sigma-70 factor [Pedobacter psychroterrae]TCD03945.1 RNA polymerase sigma-70 factor [Pedobacter psychroterrae]
MADYGFLTDAELVDLLESGDRSAFSEIYNRYKFVLHNHAWNKVRNKEEAQDTIQEVFTMLWLKRESISIGNNLPGYLYSCVRNHILNVIVRKDVQNKYISSIQQFSESAPVVTDHRVRESMLKALIDKEIAGLPPRMREVFELSRNQHLSHKEIAAIMGTTEQTVKKQVTKALKILRTKLGLCLMLSVF